MRDRSVEYPNRYRMTLVPGTTDIYEMTPVPGEVSEEGTFMSKANILDDNSEIDIWGTIGDRTPNDAFSFIGKSLLAHDKDIANLAATLEGKIVTGTYTGNGVASRTISLGFTSAALLVFNQAGGTYYSSGTSSFVSGGLALDVAPVSISGNTILEIIDGGFRTFLNNSVKPKIQTNMNGQVYHYIAVPKKE